MKTLLFAILATSAAWAATGFSDTYPAQAIRGVSTGAIKLARSNTVTPSSVRIDWGDGTTNDPGYIEQPCVYCNLWGIHTYTNAGTYQIVVTYHTGLNISYSATLKATVREIGPDDFVVVSIGDSVASGEGNPVIAGAPDLWDDGIGSGSACHISWKSGPGIAAGLLKGSNPKTPITFLHLACSGAGIYSTFETQLKAAWSVLNPTSATTRKIDALLISAGANDIAGGFGSVVKTCAADYDCSQDAKLVQDIADGIGGLDQHYKDSAPKAQDKAVETYITEYHDPTKDANGNFNGQCTLDFLAGYELKFLYNNLLVPLNLKVLSNSQTYGWHYVGKIAGDFQYHGICANLFSTWVVNLLQSGVTQGNKIGTGHPNFQGHSDIANRIVDAINTNTKDTTTTITLANAADSKPIASTYFSTGWINQSVLVSLTGKNRLPSAGVQTLYSVSNAPCATDAWSGNSYSSSFTLTNNGTQYVCYFSGNAAGKFAEPVKSAVVRIDKIPPVTTASQSGRIVTLTATDTLSGVARTQYNLNNRGWATGTSVDFSKLPAGTYTLQYKSLDYARNEEVAKSITLTF